jgi:ubiquinone/menaquinone biosynthesis C-methylase UbiE
VDGPSGRSGEDREFIGAERTRTLRAAETRAKRRAMIPRVLETEAMDSTEEAEDYDAMDHAEVNTRFSDDFIAFFKSHAKSAGARVLDVGTGTARIPILLASRETAFNIEGLDLSDAMLLIARANVARAGLSARVSLRQADAKRLPAADGSFDAVVSNTIVHHVPEPAPALAEMWRVLAPGGVLFVRDLARPESRARLTELVALHGGSPPSRDPKVVAMHERQVALFAASLEAGLTLDEVRAMVAPLGIPRDAVAMTSDRHWTLAVARRG